MTNAVESKLAIAISDYLHSLDCLQPLAWHQARGLSERLATVITEELVNQEIAELEASPDDRQLERASALRAMRNNWKATANG